MREINAIGHYPTPLGGERCPARSPSKSAGFLQSPLQDRARSHQNVSGTVRESGTRLTQAAALLLLTCSPALAIVLPDDCHTHPTPPPARYLEQAVEYQREGLAVVTVRVVAKDRVNRECQRATGLSEPVGFPGRGFGACTVMDTSGLPFRALIIIPEGGCALNHELGHVGGW